MSQHVTIDILDNPAPGSQPGGIDESEKWWVERQEALEQAGYMLRTRYRPGWRPSWAGTNKFYLDFEDGQHVRVSAILLIWLLVLMTSDALRHGRHSHF